MAKEFNYRQANQELEVILDQLQAGELDIDEAIKQYEMGMKLVEQLQTYLKAAENKITKVKKTFDK